MEIKKAWLSTFTRRWHTNPYMAATNDTNAGHQGRACILALLFFPDHPNAALHAAIHDEGEGIICDVPHPVKKKHPIFAKMAHDLEEIAIEELGFKLNKLTDEEVKMVKFVDGLDALLWVNHHNPDLLMEDHWLKYEQYLYNLSVELDVHLKYGGLIGEYSHC